MDDSLRKVEVSAFDAARVKAMDAYASLEHSMADLLALVLDVRYDRARIVFYRIVNARSRCAIISDLLKAGDGASFVKPWDKIEKQIKTIDQRRNALVHWVGVSHMGAEPGSNVAKELRVSLINPRNMLAAIKHGDGEWTLQDVESFTSDCNTLTITVSALSSVFRIREKLPESSLQTIQQLQADQILEGLRHILLNATKP